jgi:hypothetical protein
MHLLGGRTQGTGSEGSFACVLDNQKVVGARLMDSALLESLAAQDGDWSL